MDLSAARPGLWQRPWHPVIAHHLVYPLSLSLTALLLINWFSVDWRLAHWLYQWGHGQWVLKHHWLTEGFIHRGGRALTALALITLIGALGLGFVRADWRRYRSGLLYLLVSAVSGALIIASLKMLLHRPCPWHLASLGGSLSAGELLDRGGCFPSGHASGGYMWVGLYYFFWHCKPGWRKWGVLPGLVLGAVYGVGQQLRGAHFLSHDLTSLTICWLVATLTYFCWPGNRAMVALPVSLYRR